jgi:hypothetical protein
VYPFSCITARYGISEILYQREAEMDLAAVKRSEARFEKYLAGLVEVIGHADRTKPLGITAWAADAGRAQER